MKIYTRIVDISLPATYIHLLNTPLLLIKKRDQIRFKKMRFYGLFFFCSHTLKFSSFTLDCEDDDSGRCHIARVFPISSIV